MPWLEIIKLLIPLILELLNKDASQRAASAENFDATYRAALKSGNDFVMLCALFAGCICRLSDEQIAEVRRVAKGGDA